eukprot:TRINITY_DN5731_c0_g1_i1.p1 TRINITY_DN5731_c0_g1~~TRINITY_DN5731_c0_g1_i1.p1  ORF type:complete len:265 (+),score=88.11 TRINITY_DN5731_c0_g1_i1:78-797(+)
MGELGTTPVELEEKLSIILEVANRWNAVILIDEADIFLEERSKDDIMRNAMVGIFLRLLEYHQGVLFLTTNRVKCFDRAFHSRISLLLHYRDLTAEAREKIWLNFIDLYLSSSNTSSPNKTKENQSNRGGDGLVIISKEYNNTENVKEHTITINIDEPFSLPPPLDLGVERKRFIERSRVDTKELAKFEFNGRQIRNCVKLATSLSETEGAELNMTHLLLAANLAHQFQVPEGQQERGE